MGKDSPVKISEHFQMLTDPRVVGRTDHKLIDIITTALCAIICGFRILLRTTKRGCSS